MTGDLAAPWSLGAAVDGADLIVHVAAYVGMDKDLAEAVNSQWGDELVARLRQSGWPAAYHPGDVIPWEHTGDLAEMTWLAATYPAAQGEIFLAVDQCVPIRDYFVPIMTALGQSFTAPDRDPVVSRCRIGKIRAVLGYLPQRTFGQTIAELTALARSHPAQERQ